MESSFGVAVGFIKEEQCYGYFLGCLKNFQSSNFEREKLFLNNVILTLTCQLYICIQMGAS